MILIDLSSPMPQAHRRRWKRTVWPLVVAVAVGAVVVTFCLELAVGTRWRAVRELTVALDGVQARAVQLVRLEERAERLAEQLDTVEQLWRAQPRWSATLAALYRTLPDDVVVHEIRGDQVGCLLVRGVGLGRERNPSMAVWAWSDGLQSDAEVAAAGQVLHMEMDRLRSSKEPAVVEFVLRWEPRPQS